MRNQRQSLLALVALAVCSVLFSGCGGKADAEANSEFATSSSIYRPIAEVGPFIRRGEISSRDLMNSSLRRMAELDEQQTGWR